MKKISFFLLMLIGIMSVSVVSCSKDDDDDSSSGSSGSLVGTWRLTVPYDDGDVFYCQYVFNSDGTFGVKDWGEGMYDLKEPSEYEDFGTWHAEDGIISIVWEGDYVESYSYKLKGDELIIYDYEESGPNVFKRI